LIRVQPILVKVTVDIPVGILFIGLTTRLVLVFPYNQVAEGAANATVVDESSDCV
jgi:hypothetical protein